MIYDICNLLPLLGTIKIQLNNSEVSSFHTKDT